MNLRKQQISNFSNALWIVNENGIERTIPDSQEEYDYLLNDSDVDCFAKWENAVLFAISSMSKRIKELEQK